MITAGKHIISAIFKVRQLIWIAGIISMAILSLATEKSKVCLILMIMSALHGEGTRGLGTGATTQHTERDYISVLTLIAVTLTLSETQ